MFRVMEALREVPCGLWILACPEDCAATFAPLAKEVGFELSPGPKEDVLSRYCLAIRRFGLHRLIRATGDNPFVFTDATTFLDREASALGAHYSAYSGLPYGAGVESVEAEALLRAEAEATNPAEREHVCPYLYNHPESFLLHRPLAPSRWREPRIRLTVDTREDYEKAEKLYPALSGLDIQGRTEGETIIAAYKRLFPGAGESR